MANSVGFHESEDRLTATTRDLHRALRSLQEELEAIDWYQQRIDAAHDDELKAVLSHARDEEMEHAAMELEWIRRHSPEFDRTLRARLFVEGPIVEHEEVLEREESGATRTGAPNGRPGAPGGRNGARLADAATPRATVGSLREAR